MAQQTIPNCLKPRFLNDKRPRKLKRGRLFVRLILLPGPGTVRNGRYDFPHIDATVGHAVRVGRVIGVLEKHQIAGAGVGGGNRGADVAKTLRPQPPIVPAGVIDWSAPGSPYSCGFRGCAASLNVHARRLRSCPYSVLWKRSGARGQSHRKTYRQPPHKCRRFCR